MKIVVEHVHHYSFTPLCVWIVVITIIAVIGLLRESPPERPYQSFHENNQKVQYITIGGTSSTKKTDNP